MPVGQLLEHVDQLALDVVGQLLGEGRQAADTQALGGLHPGCRGVISSLRLFNTKCDGSGIKYTASRTHLRRLT